MIVDISGKTKEEVLDNWNQYLLGNKSFDVKYIPVYATPQTVMLTDPLVSNRTVIRGSDRVEPNPFWRSPRQ